VLLTTVACVVAVLLWATVVIPAFRSGGQSEDRSAEARAAMGAMKDRARVVYHRTGKAPRSFKELGLSDAELTGSYFTEKNYALGGSAENWWCSCSNVYTSAPSFLEMRADLSNGSASFNR